VDDDERKAEKEKNRVAKSLVNAAEEPASAVPAEIKKEQAELMKVRQDLIDEMKEKGNVERIFSEKSISRLKYANPVTSS